MESRWKLSVKRKEMKKLIILATCIISCISLVSCGGAKGEDPGSAYMPDMYYSRAYETYGYNNVEGEMDSLRKRGIFYNGMPVPRTLARGESFSYYLTPDSAGLAASNAIKNPLDSVAATAGDMKEAERLYLINCGICHGTKLDGNGPLWNGGNGAYLAKPQDLIGYGKNLSDGHFFHVITYGIRTMGSYASQLRPEQRWWVIKYIRSKQGSGTQAADSTGTTQPKADTTNM